MSLPVPKGPIYKDQEHKRSLETRNGVVQAAFVVEQVRLAADSRNFAITPEILKELQRLAINQIYSCAGHFRDGPVILQNVPHDPPDHAQVPGLVDEMCGYLSANWQESPHHLAAYIMWRLNWIHPFFGGNGRTARAASYLVLSARLRFELPGTQTIPELIVRERTAYQGALRHADEQHAASGGVDVSKMEELLSSLLAEQLVSVYKAATGVEMPD